MFEHEMPAEQVGARGETGLHVNLTKSGSSEQMQEMKTGLDAPNNSLQEPRRNTPVKTVQHKHRGIEVISKFFGACGVIDSPTSEDIIIDDETSNGVYVLDGTPDTETKKKTNDGPTHATKIIASTEGKGAGSTRVSQVSSFGSPDRAAGSPIPTTRKAPRSASSVPVRQMMPPETLGVINDLHEIAKAGDWPKLRECLTSVHDHSKTVSAAGEVDEKGRTPLMIACMHGAQFPADVARLLLVANNQSASLYVLQKNNGKQFCLHVATSHGCSIEVLGILHGAYPKAASTMDGNGNMPLHLAVTNGRYRSIGGQLEMRGDEMASTIITEHNQTEDAEPDCDSTIGGGSLSTQSVLYGNGGAVDDMVNVCEFLVSINPSALMHKNRRGETPLLLAIYRRSPSDVVSLLLMRGGALSLEIADDFGSYPIHFCDRSPSLSFVRDMAELFPAAIERKNKMGNTPLFSAMASSCDISVLRTMLESCARPRETVESRNGDNINILQFGWDDLTTQKVVAAEDQDDEDARLEECKNFIEGALSPLAISGKYLEDWWAKATILLQAAYHNTNKVDGDGCYEGRVWRPVHAVAGTECPTEMVRLVLRIHADEAGVVDENGNTPLHIAASRPDIIGIETIKLVLDAHPSSAAVQNKDGHSPLHVACLTQSPLQILELLLAASPEATCLRNIEGQTPLFVAIFVSSPVNVLRALLEAKPASVHIRDANGISSIALAWHMLLSGKVFEERDAEKKNEAKRSCANVNLLAVTSRSSSLKGDVRSWMSKIDLLLRAAFHGTVAESLPKGKQWRAVHAACSDGTIPPDVLAFALQILPSEAEVTNESKDYPLHIAASAPPHDANCPSQFGSGESIDFLLRINPSVAKRTDRKGRLPLHLALSSGKSMCNGVRSLVDSFHESVRMRDPSSMLYPFMLAACGDNLSRGERNNESVDLAVLNTTFALLREAPSMVLKQKSDAEIVFLRRSRKELLLEKKQLNERLSSKESDLRRRMTPTEIRLLDEEQKRDFSRQQEAKRRQRAKHLELQVRHMAETLSTIASSMMMLKDKGL
uniref:Uncharacterized protein n=1 Tax=Odontella aurita TaxID=265563 RepID=A0A7S4HQY6_9STRA|mmetsp:Transcript_13851/g.40534  ORF Transcript_13851/g.40534 Transcript_13851/m.40534 type:complete len:1055 (+) Transcript_13851:241-3405(+)